jgi:hypothetical protein
MILFSFAPIRPVSIKRGLHIINQGIQTMLLNHPFSFLQSRVSEIAIADLDGYQIIIPTASKPAGRPFLAKGMTAARREYGPEGWIVYRDRIVGTLTHLEIGATTDETGLLPPLKRLGPAVPIAFEGRSRRSLPTGVSAHAVLSCRLNHEPLPYCSLFRQQRPKFVRIYTVQSSHPREHLLKVQQLLIDEAAFVAQNREHLKNIPFYQEKFGL